jgi:hypothetical protein
MLPLTIYLAQLIGIAALVLSVSLFLRREFYIETMQALIDDRPLLLIIATTRLVIGLAIVLAHNLWSGGALTIVVTVFGWVTLIRGLLLLILPADRVEHTFAALQFERHYYVYAALPFLLGAYLTYAGFTAAAP